jgi:hypothetical protein
VGKTGCGAKQTSAVNPLRRDKCPVLNRHGKGFDYLNTNKSYLNNVEWSLDGALKLHNVYKHNISTKHFRLFIITDFDHSTST